MIQRCSTIIDEKKSPEFLLFLRENAKDKRFWDNIKREVSKGIDKKELDDLFEQN